MNFHNVALIIKREYLQRLRSPGFIIGAVLGVLAIVALAFLPSSLICSPSRVLPGSPLLTPRTLSLLISQSRPDRHPQPSPRAPRKLPRSALHIYSSLKPAPPMKHP